MPEIDLRSGIPDSQGSRRRTRRETKAAWRCCTGGTADIPVAEEAAQTAEFFGCRGGADLRCGRGGDSPAARSQRERLSKANCVIAVAGMEGALGTVVGRPGGAPGHRCSYLRGLRGQLSRAFGPPDHAEFLCKRDLRGKYRQWIRGRLSGNTNKQIGGEIKMGRKFCIWNASSGISGDMTVGALLDLGASRERCWSRRWTAWQWTDTICILAERRSAALDAV